jgi:ABC-type nickel/cobalt efflux system permease component RcnA
MRVVAYFSAELSVLSRSQQVNYQDGNYQGRVGWQEIIAQPSTGVTLLDSTVPAADLSQELRSYPADLLQSPLAVDKAQFRFQAQATAGAVAPPSSEQASTANDPVSTARRSDPFAELIAIPELGPMAILLALLAAFGWGAAHALSPGHGKTIVGAYLVGSRGATRHALFLGLTTTITHTAGVFALGLVTLAASQFIVPERLYPWLGLISGIMVAAIGLSVGWDRLRGLLGRHIHGHHHHGHDHDHHDPHHHGHDHPHEHGHNHDHHRAHDHSHLPPGADGAQVTWRSLLALGISGGLLPCPSALVVMLGAIALQRVGFGLVLIVAFSLGLASVLAAIGVILVHAGRLFERIPESGRLLRVLPVASALFITVIGVGITLRALVETGII